jgi:glycosyltransferase involved in cell wall biosynthesis
MRLLCVTNLYPRPAERVRGVFNARWIEAIADVAGEHIEVSVVSLVAEPRPWKWRQISAWECPREGAIHVRYLPYFHAPLVGRNWADVFCRKSLVSLRKAADAVDVILGTWLYPDCVAAADLAREAGKPYWLKAHGTDRLHLHHAVRGRKVLAACRSAAGVIANSEFLRNELVGAGVSREKTHVIRHGVDANMFRSRNRDESRKAVLKDREPDGPLLLFVGNLVREKGPDRALEAFRSLSDTCPATLAFVGGGPMDAELQRHAVQWGLTHRVWFEGPETPERVATWMNAADCLWVTSRSESLPNVILEALASGLPVVSMDVGGCREVLGLQRCMDGDGPGDRLSPREPLGQVVTTLDGLIHATQEAIARTPVDRQRLAEDCGRRFSWKTCAEETLAVIQGRPSGGL